MPFPNRRASQRWSVARTVTIRAGYLLYEGKIINVNFGGCFIAGRFQLSEGDEISLTSTENNIIVELPSIVAWVVQEEDLSGIGVRFTGLDEEKLHEILAWFNELKAEKRMAEQ